MIITALRLRNIKSFVDAELHFSRGINVIAGANGAGKSTVIESIGLALFDAWPQKFRDGNARTGFLRNGEKEGGIEVDVQRGDARFTVRCALGSRTRAGRVSIDYERTLLGGDGAEIASSAGRKKEFQDDVRTHILGAARIDDDRLFSDIIGTEQGAFDDPFTRAESERKALFKKILGIEDFQDFERQFHALVKMQRDEAGELEVRVDENAGVPEELAQAREELAVRETRAKDAAFALESAAAETAAALKTPDALAAQREKLEKARGERERLREKLHGAEAAAAQAKSLAEEARSAADAVRAAKDGHEAYAAAEKTLTELRKAAQERDAAKELLSTRQAKYAEDRAALMARAEGAQKQQEEMAKDIAAGEEDLRRRDARIEELLGDYASLEKEKSGLDARAAFARKLRSYVQDIDTVQRTLDNADDSLRTLRDQLADLRDEQDSLQLDADFLPQLTDEAERLFAQYIGDGSSGAAEAPFAAMLTQARDLESVLQRQVDEAARTLGSRKQEGKGARKERDDAGKRLALLRTKHEKLVADLREDTAALQTLEQSWKEERAALTVRLDAHADLDAHIAAADARLAEHRSAHEAWLAQKGAAEQLAAREKTHADAISAAEETKTALATVEKDAAKQEAAFSEEEYAAAKSALDEARAKEMTASNTVTEWKTRVEEQHKTVKKLEKEVRDFERLRLQSVRARTEADFSSEVHTRVVRELAQHVGASIVSALSAFAADLYQRIAPEQGLALHWDPATYAVELRGEQGRVRGRELSGGQLMGVSLAVKLALIKWYAQCRVGFLDEPTTHLDRETRRHLADVIQHLEQLTGDSDPWFDQLFVISHEESFAGAGHLVELARDAEAGSRVV